MQVTQVAGGTPGSFFPTLVQDFPPSRVSWMFPSSVPTHTTSWFLGDSQMVKMVQWFSADELSTERPPDSACFCLTGSLVVRSGEMRSQVSPRSRVRNRNCAPR